MRFVLHIVLYIIGYSMLIYPIWRTISRSPSQIFQNPTIGESDRKIWNIKSISLILFKFYLILWKNVNAKIICYTDLISGIVNHIRSRTFARVICRSLVNWYRISYIDECGCNYTKGGGSSLSDQKKIEFKNLFDVIRVLISLP